MDPVARFMEQPSPWDAYPGYPASVVQKDLQVYLVATERVDTVRDDVGLVQGLMVSGV